MSKTHKELNQSVLVKANPTSSYLFLALECDRPWAGGLRKPLQGLRRVVVGRGDTRRVLDTTEGGRPSLRIEVPDQWMSEEHATFDRLMGQWMVTDQSSSNGTLVNGRRVEQEPLRSGDVIALGRTIFILRDHSPTKAMPLSDLETSELGQSPPGLRTLNPGLEEQFRKVERVATAGVDVLLLGETGTGKELAARAIHTRSKRHGDFVAVNSAALTDNLLESQLFGHRQGAFSGATEERPGLVRSADHGTLFLDEIGDLPLLSQAAFLRVLQEREVTPVGATRPVSVDVRVVAATNKPLDEMVESGEFRADLLARVRGLVVHLPALTERLEDMGILLTSIAEESGNAQGLRFSLSAAMTLFGYSWPHNIRELAKCVALGAALSDDGVIHLEHLPEYLRKSALWTHNAPTEETGAQQEKVLSDSDLALREELLAALSKHGGNITAAAREMGKARTQIQRWVRRFEIDVEACR